VDFLMRRISILTPIIAVMAIAAIVAGCTAPSTPTPVPPRAEATAIPTPAPSPVDVWEQIQKSGKMTVGTAADYPPFEYYNSRYQLDGFDIGLIREIGKQLGVKVEIKDYAFDGLYNALQLAQIDVAIAAISETPERGQYVDFTDIYYVGKDGVLANARSPITSVTKVDQLATKRVGVQSGSVYQNFLEDTLVATALMPAENLYVYPDIEHAIKDLKNSRIDLVLLDYLPAEAYVQQGGVKLVGESVNPQSFAMAIPKGADSFRRVLNKAFADLVSSGAYARLAKTHLGLEPDNVQPVPTPAPAQPTPTPAPNQPAPTAAPAACIDGMSYVADITYDDANMTAPPVLQPGQPFVKTWRVRNSGTCTWTSAYYLAYAHGNTPQSQMGGQPTYIKGSVPPGGTYDISVNLVAPTQPGVYQGFWQMVNATGTAFGTTIYVGIQVQAPTAVPAPTQTPSPTISFTVNQTNITAGQCVTFNWNVQNVKAVYFYPQGADMTQYGVAGQGSSVQCPTQTTTYNLTVVYNNGTTETRSITIYVTPAPVGAPYINLFTVTPPQIQPGQCVNLQWDVAGSVTQISLTRGSTNLWGNAPVRGQMQDCPPGTGSVTYTLMATGPGGQSQGQQYVNVVAPQPTAVPPTAVPPTKVPPTAVPPTAAPPTAVPPTAVPPTAVPPTAAPPTAVPVPPIVGKNWALLTYNNGQGALVSPIAGTQITALFGTDGKVTGTDSCNTYNAPYTVNGSNLQVGAPALTSMACPEDVTAQAQNYLAALQHAYRYEVAGSQLTIFDSIGTKLLQYAAQ
jgi:ABC-type amino acid transport substrate-binding protein/heat shock protein HslJ